MVEESVERQVKVEEIVEACMAEIPLTRKGIKQYLKTYLRHTEKTIRRLDCLAIIYSVQGNNDASAALGYAASMLVKAKELLEQAEKVI